MTACGRVTINGCGEIGTRHLQAAVTLPGVSAIEVVDPRPESWALGRQRICETPDARPDIPIRWLTSVADAGPADLCIVATRAQGRCALVREAADRGSRAFLLEKIVTTSVAEYDELLSFAEARALPMWVNCKTRTYPFHKRTRDRFAADEPIQFHVLAGNHGLACNGLHSVDLFAFYDRCTSISPVSAAIDPILHHTKRGNGIFDLSGTLTAVSDRGSSLVLSFAADHLAPSVYLVSSPRHRFVLDQLQPFAQEASAAANWAWSPVAFEGNFLISHMSRTFIADILDHGTCELPTLRECFAPHAYLLTALQPWFSTLMGREVDELPVT